MKTTLYNEMVISIYGVNKLTKEDQLDLRRLVYGDIGNDIRIYIEDELIPEHLKNKVKVVIQ